MAYSEIVGPNQTFEDKRVYSTHECELYEFVCLSILSMSITYFINAMLFSEAVKNRIHPIEKSDNIHWFHFTTHFSELDNIRQEDGRTFVHL